MTAFRNNKFNPPPSPPVNDPIVVHRVIEYDRQLKGKPGLDGKNGTTIDLDKTRQITFDYIKDPKNPLVYKRIANSDIVTVLEKGLYRLSIQTFSGLVAASPCISYSNMEWVTLEKSIDILSLEIDGAYFIPEQFEIHRLFKNAPNFKLRCFIEAFTKD